MVSDLVTLEKMIENLNELPDISCFIEKDELVIAFDSRVGGSSVRKSFNLEEVVGEFEKIAKHKWSKPFLIVDNKHYEARVFFQDNSSRRNLPFFLLEEEILSCKNDSNGISINISEASTGYKLMTLCRKGDQVFEDYEMPFRMRLRSSFRHADSEKSSFSEWLSHFHILTVRVDSDFDLDAKCVVSLLEDYYFNIAEVFNIAATMRSPFIKKVSRYYLEKDIDLFPYRSHDKNISKYYLQAVSSKGTPIAEYLSFYHVIEYQFDRDLEKHILRLIEQAAYSCQKSSTMLENTFKDINSIYTDRKYRGQERSDLTRCIKDFVDISSLVRRLDEIQDGSVGYYRKNNVKFIVDDDNPKKETDLKIDFANPEKAYEKIASRIYSVRCAIVHSKSNIESRYEPFRHDELLHKEMPLVQAVAEEVLRETSDLRKL